MVGYHQFWCPFASIKHFKLNLKRRIPSPLKKGSQSVLIKLWAILNVDEEERSLLPLLRDFSKPVAIAQEGVIPTTKFKSLVDRVRFSLKKVWVSFWWWMLKFKHKEFKNTKHTFSFAQFELFIYSLNKSLKPTARFFFELYLAIIFFIKL